MNAFVRSAGLFSCSLIRNAFVSLDIPGNNPNRKEKRPIRLVLCVAEPCDAPFYAGEIRNRTLPYRNITLIQLPIIIISSSSKPTVLILSFAHVRT